MTKEKVIERVLNLDEDWRIKADNTCFTLQKKRIGKKGKAKDKVFWDDYAYHTRPDQMFACASCHISLDNWPDLKLINKKIDEIRSLIAVFIGEIKS